MHKKSLQFDLHLDLVSVTSLTETLSQQVCQIKLDRQWSVLLNEVHSQRHTWLKNILRSMAEFLASTFAPAAHGSRPFRLYSVSPWKFPLAQLIETSVARILFWSLVHVV